LGRGERSSDPSKSSAVSPNTPRIDRRALSVLLFLFVVSLPVVTARIYASDEIEYYAFLRSLWFDHDFSFENEYRHFYEAGVAKSPGFHETFLERTTATGLRVNFGTIGPALLWAPFFAAGDGVARAIRALGGSVAIDGYSFPYIASVCYGSAFYGMAALLISMVIAVRLAAMLGGRQVPCLRQIAAPLAVWLGTPLFFYMYVAPPMSHAASAFAVAAFVLAWLEVRRTWSARGLVVLGVLAALMSMVREQDFFFVAGPAADFAWTLVRGPGQASRGTDSAGAVHPATRLRLVANASAGCAAGAVAYLPQAIAYLALNGRLRPSQLVTRKMNWLAPHALQVLGSPEHGLLAWTPLVLLALAGLLCALVWRPARSARAGSGGRANEPSALVRSPEDLPRIAACLLLMVVLQVYIAGSVESWTVAGAFGQRRFVALTVVLVAGLALLIEMAHGLAWRSLVAALLALSVWWNIGLMVQFGAGLMDRQRLELARNAYTSFVVLPRTLPEYAYRYLVRRESFYRGPAVSAPSR
jgi:hypothetical protein